MKNSGFSLLFHDKSGQNQIKSTKISCFGLVLVEKASKKIKKVPWNRPKRIKKTNLVRSSAKK